MLIWEIIWGLLALNQLGDAARNRRRFMALQCLGDGSGPQVTGFRVMVAPGVEVDDATRQAALAYIHAQGLAALDLVPGQMPIDTAWSIGCHVDPEASRTEGWQTGATACHAFLAPDALLSDMGIQGQVRDLGTFVALAGEVKRRVSGRHDLAIAPGLEAMRPNPFFRAPLLSVRLGGGVGPVAIGMPIMWAIVALGLALLLD